jgi:S-adenosylmethionine synthetase
MKRYIFTSESVSEGHPDKVCDQISDSILDAFLEENSTARVAMEALATTNKVVLAGEVRGNVSNERMEEIVRSTVKNIGYDQAGFSWKTLNVDINVHTQSSDIALGVDAADSKDEGAGDQGIMFGYACKETDSFMPATLHYSHKILKKLSDMRKNGEVRLLPDAKSQISLLYEDGKPVKATSIVVSTQHTEETSQEEIRSIVVPVIEDVLPKGWIESDTQIFVNPTGRFVIGGPDGDTGLTGRKIIVDTYGGVCPHGGGAFSGKDPTKVDRSAAYMARYLAKNIVAAGLSETCTIQLAYAIGISHPLAVYVDFKEDPNSLLAEKIATKLPSLVDLSPRGIRTHLELNKPIYAKTAAYGHFGRDPEADGAFSWERLDLVSLFKSEF